MKKRSFSFFSIFILLAILFAPLNVSAAGGDKVWEFQMGNSTGSSPTVSGGYVYIGSGDYKVYCLNAQTGIKVWEYLTGGAVQSSPAVSDGYVYVGSRDYKLYCLNAQTGAKVWDFQAGGGFDCSPAVTGGYVYVGSDDKKIYCLNAQTGAKVWDFQTGGRARPSPAVTGGCVYAGNDDAKVYCLNAQTGEKVWEFPAGALINSSPAVTGGYVYVGSDDKKIYCLHAQTGAKVWDFQTDGSVPSSPAISGGYVYVGSNDTKIYCLNAQTGQKVWEYQTGAVVNTSPAVTGGYVYVGSNDTKVYCLNAQTGQKVWEYQTGGEIGGTSPAVTSGYVFAASWDNKVYCLKAADGDMGSWPMFRYNRERTGAIEYIYSISGTVSGSVQASVMVTLSGNSSASTITDFSGNYSFSGLSNGTYTATPSKAGYAFTPSNRQVTISGADQTGINFTSSVFALPETGQTKCYDTSGTEISCSGTGQDGEYQAGVAWPSPRFTPNADTTITDNLTGLVWAPDGNIMPTRDSGWDADGTANDGAVTWQHALDYVAKLNSENYLGHNDWRLPNVNELESLINTEGAYTYTDHWLNSQGFTNVQQAWYWSSTTTVRNTGNAWVGLMGSVFYGSKSDNNSYVWPVRGLDNTKPAPVWKTGQTKCYDTANIEISCAGTGQDGEYQAGVAWPSPRFTDNGNGTVTDNLTGLMWTKNANLPNSSKTWQQALDYVASMNSGSGTYGYTDWRLPNWEELYSLIDYSEYYPPMPAGHPFTNVADDYWSSTTYAAYPSLTGCARDVGMSLGFVTYYYKSDLNYVWPVRGGTGVNTPTYTYSISGTVSGAIQAGVTMTLSGAASKTTATDSSGNYSFTGLINGSYTVTPSKTGYTFTPTNTQITISGANQTGVNFTATSSTCTVTITPSSASKKSGETQTFTATTTGTGCKTGTYTWSVSSSIGSTITQSGVYTAGWTCSQVSDTITATDTANNNITAQATVIVDKATCTVSITPTSATKSSGGTQTFTAYTTGTNCKTGTYTWSVSSTIGSTITQSGVYTAGTTTQTATDTITVTDTANCNITAQATITVTSSTCTVNITPSAVTKSSGGTQTFSASTSGTGCKTGTYAWSVTSSIGSTITQSGVYTAGNNTTGQTVTDTITATDTANGNITGQATVTVATVTLTCTVTPTSIVLCNAITVAGTITPPQSIIIEVIFTAPSTARITPTAMSDSNGAFQLTYTPDTVGTWKVKAKYGTAESSETSFTITKAPTTLTCNIIPPAIKKGETVDISGALTPNPNCGTGLSNLTISLAIITPEGAVKETKTASTNQYGQYTLNKYAGLNETGTWEIHVSFAGSSNYNSSTSECEVIVQETAGYAILIEGRISGGQGQDGYNKTLNGVYDQFINRSFSSDDIYYFNYQIPQDGVDATTTKSGIEYAIETWAKTKMNQNPAPLYLVIVDHGEADKFYIDPYTVTPAELDNWVTTLETGLTGSALSQEIIIVLGACYSGSFIDDLSEVGRVIITSAAPNEQSYKGPKDNDGIRDGEYFVTEFFKEAGKEKNLKEAFKAATQRTETWTTNKGCPKSIYYDNACQHPLLDDNGDKIGSNDLSTAGDGKVAETLYLGIGKNAGESVEIVEVSPTITLLPTETKPTLWAKVSDPNKVDTIWVEIKTPDYQPIVPPSGEVTQDLPTCTYDSYNPTLGRYEWTTCDEFMEAGTYEVFYFAKDRNTGEISPFLKTTVYKKEESQPPTAFSLLSPEDGTEVKTTLVLDWEDSTDPEGEQVTYTLEISKDQTFSTIVYKKDGLLFSTCGIDEGAGLEDLVTYYWRVNAYDPYGWVTQSKETFSFTTNDTNFIPGLITGYLVDAATSDFIPYAEVETDTGGAGIAVGGYYIMTVPAGICTVTASATGYDPASQAGVEVGAGETVTVNLSLSGGATTWKDVINEYDDYVAGNCEWADVIATYNAYVGS